MAQSATFGSDISPEMVAAMQARRGFAPDEKSAPDTHLYEKHGLAPGKMETGYSTQRTQRDGNQLDTSNMPTVIHRNPNPPHINTTAPLGQRQGGYAAGVAAALFFRYFFEWAANLRYDSAHIQQTKYDSRVSEYAEKKGYGLVESILNANRSAFEGTEKLIAGKATQYQYPLGNTTTSNNVLSDVEKIHADSLKLGPRNRSALQNGTNKQRVFDQIRDVFENLGAENAGDQAKRAINNAYSRLFSKTAENAQSVADMSPEALRNVPLELSSGARKDFESFAQNSIKKELTGRFMDYGMGGYSLLVTSAYAGKVLTDIKRLMSEVVAFEEDKAPEDVSLLDIWRSQNGVVKETWNNLAKRNLVRYASDGIFFGRALFKGTDFWKLGLVSKGALVIQDTWLRRLTTFEKITNFVESVIKPEDGLGTPVSSENLVDIFQSFTVHNRPDMSFQSVVGNNATEEVRWDYARQIFDRMATLMNQSYSYKHDVRYDDNFQPLAQGNFTLPVFIFMLGHDMIDPNNPNFTMARIEIASEYGVPALKAAHKEFQAAQNLSEPEQLVKFNTIMAQFPEANVTWRSRSERLETAKKQGSAKEEAPLRPEDAPDAEHVDLEHAAHEKLDKMPSLSHAYLG